jgi:hypothetical protein
MIFIHLGEGIICPCVRDGQVGDIYIEPAVGPRPVDEPLRDRLSGPARTYRAHDDGKYRHGR